VVSRKTVVSSALAVAAVILASVAAAGGAAARQRVAITASGGIYGFALTPLGPGRLTRDSGSANWCCWSQRFLRRDGQAIEVNDPLLTLRGKRGSLELRFRTEWVDAGNSYSVGTATWKVVGGTGAYKGLSGRGRSGQLWIGQNPTSWRAEGLVR
jgi:hypothetical protein